jgi:hypothetical protein
MFRRRWPAYSAVLLLAVGIACLIALVIKSPGDDGSAIAKHTQPAAATVAMPAKPPSASSGAARTS